MRECCRKVQVGDKIILKKSNNCDQKYEGQILTVTVIATNCNMTVKSKEGYVFTVFVTSPADN